MSPFPAPDRGWRSLVALTIRWVAWLWKLTDAEWWLICVGFVMLYAAKGILALFTGNWSGAGTIACHLLLLALVVGGVWALIALRSSGRRRGP